jgi:hypothetical protein
MINQFMLVGIILILTIAIVLLVIQLLKTKKINKENKTEFEEFKNQYSGITDKDDEIKKRQIQLTELNQQLKLLKDKYETATIAYNELNDIIYLYQDNIELIEYGVYEPHFNYDTSEKFKEAILRNKEKQKTLIKDEKAVQCFTNWSVGSSQKKGEMMVKRNIKLTTRAFNGECDSLIGSVKWNNVETYEKRIDKSFDAINKMNKSNDVHITTELLNLKHDELRLTHEYALKKQEEKEEQRRIREQIREEEKARRDFDKAIKETEKEEKMLQKAMEKARQELKKSSNEEKAKYENQLNELLLKLEEAEAKNKRAISMAQQTKSGHVYVISNLGSFGENVYKIGMTRRLDPMDRVLELGDASVPFRFDVHAMIYSDNAPELENKLHKIFHKKRLNHVNLRREYFDITLEEIENVVKENYSEIEFTKVAEASEYRESRVIRKKLENDEKLELPMSNKFPTSKELFN